MNKTQLFEQAKISLKQCDYERSVSLLESCIEENPEELTYYWYLGLVYLLQENKDLAQEIWLSIFLQENLEEVEQWTSELIQFLEIKVQENIIEKKLGNAKIIYDAIFIIDADYENIELLNNLVEALSDLADSLSNDLHRETAVEVYLEILNLNSNHIKSWYSLAVNYYQLSWYIEAKEAIDKAIELEDLPTENRYHLNVILEEIKDYPSTIEEHQELVEKNPTAADAHYRLGNIYLQKGQIDDAIKTYKVAINLFPTSSIIPIFYKLSTAYRLIGNKSLAALFLGYFDYSKRQNQTAINYFEEFLASQTADIDIDTYISITNCYILINKPDLATILIKKALDLFPNNLSLKRLNQTILPIIYKNTEEITFYRQRFCQLLNQLIQGTEFNTPKQEQEAIDSIQVTTNFYLGYQGENDLDIQKQYGNYVHRLVSKRYSQYSQPVSLSQDIKKKKIVLVIFLVV